MHVEFWNVTMLAYTILPLELRC